MQIIIDIVWIRSMCRVKYSRMTTAAVSFLFRTGGTPQPSSNSGTMTYSAHVRAMIATEDGLSRIIDTQEKRKAGIGPKASYR